MECEPLCGSATPYLHSILTLLVAMDNEQYPAHMQEQYIILSFVEIKDDHLCGLVVRIPGYRSRGPGSIPGATRFWVWNPLSAKDGTNFSDKWLSLGQCSSLAD
jgi:hypothetical protein